MLDFTGVVPKTVILVPGHVAIQHVYGTLAEAATLVTGYNGILNDCPVTIVESV